MEKKPLVSQPESVILVYDILLVRLETHFVEEGAVGGMVVNNETLVNEAVLKGGSRVLYGAMQIGYGLVANQNKPRPFFFGDRRQRGALLPSTNRCN
jgi:hypothetical protein